MKLNRRTTRGFTLIELIVIMLVLGVLATAAITKLSGQLETSKVEHTKIEMEQLSLAIVGSPRIYTEGARSDFGFVGDIGSLPANLDALMTNPGGYATWKGPYMETGLQVDDFKKDAWNVTYLYNNTLIRSTGSGSNIDKLFAGSIGDLLSNSVEGTVRDADLVPPGSAYRDSIQAQLVYPNGSGGTATSIAAVNNSGRFQFAGIPIGNHTLRVIHLPTSDTVSYSVAVYPGHTARLDIVFPADLW